MKQTDRRPSFWWQGVLILAPVAVLACVGIVVTRKDRQAVRHEAEQQARALSERAAVEVWDALRAGSNSTLRMQIDHGGRLLKPAAYNVAPAPMQYDLAALSPNQRDSWLALDPALDISILAENADTFLATSPPAPFQAAAHLLMGRRLVAERNYTGAAAHFSAITNMRPTLVAESGLPFTVLARIHLHTALVHEGILSGEEKQASTAALLALAIEQPSTLTPELLRRAANDSTLPVGALEPLRQQWEQDEQARHIHRALQSSFQRQLLTSLPTARVPGAFEEMDAVVAWIQWTNLIAGSNELRSSPVTWCVVRMAETNGATLLCYEPRDLETVVTHALSRFKLPPFLGFSMAVADKPILDSRNTEGWDHTSGGKGGGHYLRRNRRRDVPRALASYAHLSAGQPAVTASVHLVSPDLLYARQNQRIIWLGLVIGAASLTAVIGFFAAYRAFARQLRLAEMKSNFVSSVSHELRAPIASMRLMAEGLERGAISDPPKQEQYFRFIVQECRRLSSMIENVLDFSRIDQGRKRYVLEPTNLRAVLDQTLALMQPHAMERGVTLRAAIPGETDWTAMADGHAIQQALVNLIDNAIKHSSNGQEVAVELRSTQPVDGQHAETIEIAVSDDGPGIPPAEHQRIFDRFYRLGSELRRETAGVGIGLSIARHIMNGHGGDVRVHSEPGHGSTFMLEWPRGNGEANGKSSEATNY